MRRPADPERVRRFMAEVGRRARGPGRIYLVGGATALLEGWRTSTIDIDLKLDPEPAGIFEALAETKRMLEINVELASPDQYLPPLPGWRERSVFIRREGEVEFFHYDFRAQALAKLARGHDRDLRDVEEMLRRELVRPAEILRAFDSIRGEFLRYPSLDADAIERRIRLFFEEDDREL